jgi:adenylosuccinate lyase
MAVSELSRSRPVGASSNQPGVLGAVRSLVTKVRSSLGKLVSLAFLRVLLIFVVGFAAGVAWQSYGNDARKTVAGWSPRLAWAAPAATTASTSRDRLRATSLALTSVRQSLNKLATEVDKLQDQDVGSASRRGSQRR